MKNTERLIEICRMVARDAEADVNAFSKEFTGPNVSEMFGKQGAAIQTLARILEAVLVELRP